jgi:glycosyltransferase involved in cell wall biosynthesis
MKAPPVGSSAMQTASSSSSSPPRTAAIIPARNEANTVGGVVYAALDARLVDEVIVVDNGSTDGTGAVAANHGARVVEAPAPGKGEAMMTGVAATDAEVIVFLDADLVVLRPDHVDSLVELVRNGYADMACGLFDRGPVKNPFFLAGLPVLTGQRALHRSLFQQLEPEDIRGYRAEAALNMLVMRNDLVRVNRVLPGLWHRTKQEKLSNPLVGYARKVIMLTSACWNYVRFAVRKPGADVKVAR